jgi:hypothetical protein
VSTQAAAPAAAGDVVRLETAYQQAFTAIETLVAAIEACSNSAANSAHRSRPPSSASQ